MALNLSFHKELLGRLKVDLIHYRHLNDGKKYSIQVFSDDGKWQEVAQVEGTAAYDFAYQRLAPVFGRVRGMPIKEFSIPVTFHHHAL